VIIYITLVALNDVDVDMTVIENAYLMAPLIERVWTALGSEFVYDSGKRAQVVRVLYGLKSARTVSINHLAECMKHLGWNPCCTDRDLWMKANTRPDDDMLYWAYILIYVDDILCVHHDPGMPDAKLDSSFKIKKGSIQVPTFYLGVKLKKTVLPNGMVDWDTSNRKCVQCAVQNIQENLVVLPGSKKPPKKPPTPFAGGYKPDLDESNGVNVFHLTVSTAWRLIGCWVPCLCLPCTASQYEGRVLPYLPCC
jgi:hypothetical protein